MKVTVGNPPFSVREKCEKYFDLSNVRPVFTYGDTIYNPYDGDINPFLMAHEVVHTKQQGDRPDMWWDNYFLSTKFRFKEELAAYRVQYRVMKANISDRNFLNKMLISIAKDLSGPMYGNLCSLKEALNLIKKDA